MTRTERRELDRLWKRIGGFDFIEASKSNGNGSGDGCGRGFDGEPRRTACTELCGDDTVIPNEAWMIHGESEEELDMGFFPNDLRDPEVHHVELENLAEEDLYPERHDDREDEREENSDPEWNPKGVVQAGANLIMKLGIEPTSAMCSVVGAYMGRTECRMDGVIDHCLNCRRDNDIVEASVEFAGKMEKYFPEISKKAKNRLIADAQRELQLRRRTDGPAYRLGKAIYNSNWSRFLRATV